jgi:predicted nucleic acid-binding protein
MSLLVVDTDVAWIAATALYLNAPLVTNNEKHFRHIPDLQLWSA